jgi:multidrug efflux system membrane fusion protein
MVALACAGCAHEEPYEKPRTPVRVETLGPAAGSASLRYSAAILPTQTVPVAFKVPGYIEEITGVRDGAGGTRILQEGDRVTRGQTLARLRTDDFTVKVNQAKSQQAEVEAAFAQARQASVRATALYEKKSLTRGDYDAAKAAYESVRAKQDGDKALVAEASNALSDSAIKSPIDGTIIKRMVEVGSLVGPGTPGFVVADTTSLKVLFGAPDLVVRRLKRGQPLAITTETYPNERFPGRITSLAPAADPGSLVFDVEVTVPNKDGRLKPGMVASLEIPAEGTEAAEPRIALPLAAIVRSPQKPDGYAVFVIEDRAGTPHAKLREVTLGEMISNGVAVTGGLRAGERLIVSGANIVADGEAVEILR